MDLLNTVRKTGSRGGVNFSWDDVATSEHRQNYLGHSLKAPVGRWAQGHDLNWYAKSDPTAAQSGETEAQKQTRERREEIQKIKQAEEEVISRALGIPITPRNANASGANSVAVGTSRIPDRTEASKPTGAQEKEGRREKHRDSERRHRRRHRSGDRDRHRERTRDRHHDRNRSRSDSRERVRDRSRDRTTRDSDRKQRHSRERRHRDDQPRDRSRSRERGNRRHERQSERKRERERSRSPRRDVDRSSDRRRP